MTHSVGVAMLGGNPLLGRKKHDFYATLPDVFLAVRPRLDLRGPVHEFCCGDGAICRLLEAEGIKTIATDLHDRGYGEAGHDALKMDRLLADELVTNPPFDIAPQIIERVLAMRPRILALLLKATFFHAARRTRMFRETPPSAIYALSWRPDFEGLGNPTMEMVWVVWDRDHVGPTVYDILDRPPGYAVTVQRKKKPKKPKDASAPDAAAEAAGAVPGEAAPAAKPPRKRPRLKVVTVPAAGPGALPDLHGAGGSYQGRLDLPEPAAA